MRLVKSVAVPTQWALSFWTLSHTATLFQKLIRMKSKVRTIAFTWHEILFQTVSIRVSIGVKPPSTTHTGQFMSTNAVSYIVIMLSVTMLKYLYLRRWLRKEDEGQNNRDTMWILLSPLVTSSFYHLFFNNSYYPIKIYNYTVYFKTFHFISENYKRLLVLNPLHTH